MKHRLVGGYEHFGYGGRVHVIQLGRDGHGHAVVDPRQFGVSAAADDAHDPVTNVEAADSAAFGDHLAGDFQPDDRRVAEVRAPVATAAMGEVCAVDPGGVDAHQQVGGAHLRVRHFRQFEYVSVAEGFKGNGFHGECVSAWMRVCGKGGWRWPWPHTWLMNLWVR